MVCRYFKRLRRKPVAIVEVPTFDRLSPHPQLIYRRYGTLTPTQRIAIHSLTAKRIRGSSDILEGLPLGRTGTRSLVEAERRPENKRLWLQFLGMDEEGSRQIWALTHTIHWGYIIRSHGIPKDLLSASLNFAVPGHDSDWACSQCLDFLTEYAINQRSRFTDTGVILPKVLIKGSRDIRILWLSLLYMHWRYLKTGK
ncbi:hypothetical protein [Pantanalinema sp. GBBB05]|uniref:hypothetical protein n=1 Tax=Pantanalinema sp. GBBB05 TaxID=2604139 RepID=UPI001DE9AD6D|nr:hypothetical protein [Pantanalinema sp. GBBB05]